MEILDLGTASAYFDCISYRAVHFYGSRMHIPLRAAADYLAAIEAETGMPAHVVCSNETFTDQHAGGALAWKVTLVINDDDDG